MNNPFRLTTAVGALLLAGAALHAQPSNGSISPSSGSGATQSFTFTATSSDWGGAASVQAIFNWGLWSSDGCYLLYNQSAGLLYVYSMTSGWQAVTPGAGSASNPYCTLNGVGSSASVSGSNLSVTFSLTFNPSFLGPQNAYMVAYDASGGNSGWQQMGTWTGYAAPYTQAPTVAVTPTSGAGMGQTFTFTATDLNGAAYMPAEYISLGLYGSPGCTLIVYHVPILFYLVSDDGTWTYVPTGGSASNSQCTIYSASGSDSGNNWITTVSAAFSASYAGTSKPLYLTAFDHAGQSAGAQVVGTWTVPASPSDNAACSSMTVPSTVSPGAVIPFSVTMQNNGTQNWTGERINGSNFMYLGINPWDSGGPFGNMIYMSVPGTPQIVFPGQSVTFNGANASSSVVAPSTPGTYTFSWQMGHQGGPDWSFGAACSQQVTVPAPAAAPIFTPAGGLYTTTQSVALSSATPNAKINYIVYAVSYCNNNPCPGPTETTGTLYNPSSPISVTAASIVKAIAYETNWLDSSVTAETYYFSNPTGGSGTGGAGSGTPPADSGNGLDPRRVGVRALGSYWGDAGENLDTTSGNLNFSNTMIKPFGRGNWTLPFMLSYNSQIWRKDSGGDWLMGEDVGYGMGWKLQMGSLTPVWSTTSTIDHYIFTDASGAEYNLSVNTGGVWTSTEGTYISYDSNANRIYNNDGSYWVMGCTSAGTEQDAGVMYPTLAENANGNQITIAYQAGQGMGTGNTSARISTVTDTRGSYAFTYATLSPGDDIQHLTSIGGEPGESWILTYAGANLASPLSGAAYGAIELLTYLQQVNGPTSPAHFSYNNGAEMAQYTSALGGSISWGYSPNAYSGGITLNEVTSRAVNQGTGGFTNSHTLSHPTTCDTAGGAYHACTQILDNGAGSKKIYYAAAQSSLVLPSEYQETANDGSTLLLQKIFTWTQNSLSNNWYVGSVATTLNPGGSNAATTSTAQTLDNYGNMTAQNVNDYGSSTVSRSYNLNYVTDANYTNRYLRNLLGTAYVTANNVTTMLVNNGYDGTGLGALQVPKDQWGSTVTLPQHDSAYDTTATYRGNVTSAWKMGTSTSYAYDIGGNPYKAQDGDLMTVSLATSSSTGGSLPALLTPNSNSNLATGMTYASSFAPTSVTGANGATQSITYDGSNRPSSSTSVDGAVTSYTYAYGPATQTATISTTTNGTTTTQWRTTTYDGFGRTIKVQTGHDSTPTDTVNVDTVYGACGCSPLGKVVKVSMPYRQGETEVWTTYTYDGSGRQLTSTVPDGSVTTTSYSGHSVTSTDPAGIWKTNIMDVFGNLTTVYEPDPVTGSPTTGPATYYAYNGANQLTNVYLTRSGIAQNRSFTYNGSDMLTETTPEAGTVTYTYDNNHHVLTRTDAKGQQTQYEYDSYERLTEVRHYTPTGTNNALVEQTDQRVDYSYDLPVDNTYTQNYTWGRLSGVAFQAQNNGQGPYFLYEYSYNQAGRVTGNRMLMGQGSNYLDLQGQYAWDNQGRMTQMTYPSGPAMNYQFDPMGRPVTINETGISQAIPVTATYGSAGQLTSLQWGTSASYFSETRTYNSMLQLTAMSGTGLNMQYVYNTGHNNGRVSQTIDSVLGETVNYSYDYLHRLTGATATNGTWGEAYAYDGFGNLTSKTPTVGSAPAYTATDTPATNAPGPADANGNLTGANGNSPTQWDVENRLAASRVSSTGNSYTYVYDPWGRRIWKQELSNGTTTCEAYFYGATGQKLESYLCGWGSNGGFSATLQGINTYFGGKLLSEKGVYVATDRLGSVRANSNGESFSYYPWGEERGAGTADGRTKFAGYYRDMPGQDYAMARYYSGTTGSFWSPDPGGMKTADSAAPLSWNRYAYVGGDPVNASDPSGMEQASPCGPGWESDPSLQGPCCDPAGNGLLGAAPDPACYLGGGGDGPVSSPAPAAAPDCNALLEADIANFLGAYKGSSSPLYTWANMDAIVQAGMDYDVDPRLIVGLAVAESQAGTNLTWGPYNAWNNAAYKPPNSPYTSWSQAITSVALLADKYISGNGLNDTRSFYKTYEATPNYKVGLGNLNNALTKMGGDKTDLTDPCNPANPRAPNK